MTGSYFTDPGQDLFLHLRNQEDEVNQRQWERMAQDPRLMSNLAQYSTLFPTGSAELGLGLAIGGIPPSDPTAAALVNQELAVRDTLGPVERSGGGLWDSITGVWDEWVDNPIKGSVRWGFAAWDAAYQMIAGGAPIRAMELANQTGMSFSEAWFEQDPYFFEALGGVIQNLNPATPYQRVNLSSGWFPNSDIAPDVQEQVNREMEALERQTANLPANERYVRRLEGAPGVWSRAVESSLAQKELGNPIVQRNYVDTESVIFNVDQWGTGKTVRTPWSPGRIYAANFTEPGTDPFAKISATADFTAQIVLDPVDWIGGAWAKAGKNGRKVWGLMRKVADEVESAATPGLVHVPRQGPPIPSYQGAPDPTRVLAAQMGPRVKTKVVEGVAGDVITHTYPDGTVWHEPIGYTPKIAPSEVPAGPQFGPASLPGVPWWRSPATYGERVVGPFDPPKWAIEADLAEQARHAEMVATDAVSFTTRRLEPGHYVVGQRGTTNYGEIFREGKRWVVRLGDEKLPMIDPVTGSPGPLEPTRYKTLREAEHALRQHLDTRAPGAIDDPMFAGQTMDEFIATGEEFIVDDFARVARGGAEYGGPVPNRAGHLVREVTTQTSEGGRNARVTVYGKTLDLSSGVLPDDAPQALRNALKADSKLRGNKLQGFGNPKIDIFHNTILWMERNGYGKLKYNDDVIIVSDKFIGGDAADPLGRVWFDSGDQPIWRYDLGDAPTPNEINKEMEIISRSAQAAADDVAAAPKAGDTMSNGHKVGTNQYGKTGVRENPEKWYLAKELPDGTPTGIYRRVIDEDGVARLEARTNPAILPEGSRGIDFERTVENIRKEIQRLVDMGPTRAEGEDIAAYRARQAKIAALNESARRVETFEPGQVMPTHVQEIIDEFGELPGGGRPISADEWADAAENTRLLNEDIAEFQEAGAQARRALSEDPAMKEAAAKIKAADNEIVPSGALDGVRPDFDPNFDLRGKKVERLLDRIEAGTRRAGQKDTAQLDKTLKFLDQNGRPMPNAVRTRLFEAKSRQAIRSILGEWLVKEGGQQVIMPGGLQYGKLGRLGDVGRRAGIDIHAPKGIARRFSQWPGTRPVNMVEDPSAAYAFYNEAITSYNIRRGDVLQAYDDAGKVLPGVEIKIEDLFERLRKLTPGNKPEAFAIQGEFARAFFSSLVGEGVDPKLANYSAKWWLENGDMALYAADRFGRPDLGSSPYDMTNVGMDLIGGVGPGLSSDLWTGAIKPIDARTMKRINNETDLLGRISNAVAWTWETVDGIPDIHERALIRFMDDAMQRVWKPFVLLRGAWTLRILMDDQMRLGAEGFSVFNHPLHVLAYALTHPEDFRSAFRTGTVDVFGTPMKISHIDEMKHAELFHAALMRSHDPQFGPGAFGRTTWTRALRGEPKYVDGLSFEVAHMRGDDIISRLAKSESQDPVEEVTQWLLGNGPAEERQAVANALANQAEVHKKMGDIPQKILNQDEETIRNIVNRNWATMHHRTGGRVFIDNGMGQQIPMHDVAGYGRETGRRTGKAFWIVEQDGDPELIRLIAGEEKLSDGRFIGELSTEESVEELNKYIRQQIRANENYGPVGVRAPKTPFLGREGHQFGDMWDRAVKNFFNWFMTKPSDQLSRIPEFNRAYWQKIADLYPYMDDTLRKRIDVIATETNPRAQWGLKQARKEMARNPSISGQLTDMDQVDQLAKSYGLTMVERTLFTLTEKRNISDSLRLVFPFVEAWGEFISRWGRLMVYGDRNIKNANRLRQIVGGARRSGFFEENDFGQEVFSIPAFATKAQVELHNKLNNLPFGENVLGPDVSPEVANAIDAQGNVESLNFASGIFPGFGPIFQMASKALPANPDYDWVRDIVAPFGTEGGPIANFAPAWIKRIVSAHGGADDPVLTYAYNSTVTDVLRTMIDRGDFAGVTDVAGINELVRQAEDEAQGLLMVRAAATFWNPAAPIYKFQKEDKDGLVWSYTNLGGAFYDLMEEYGGDEMQAFDEFYRRFGFLPQPFRGGKTYSVMDRSRTETGYAFERGNPQLFEDYPSVAMYFDPTVGLAEEYDHNATLVQLQKGLRESWNAEQFVYVQQDQLGSLWWDNVQRIAATIGEPAMRDAYLASMRDQIKGHYPYWDEPIPGKRQAVTNEQQREELLRALDDSRVAGLPVVEAVKRYEAYYEEVMEEVRRAGASTISGPKSMSTEAGRVATMGRSWLRQKAEELSAQYPTFEPLFRSVYAAEVSTSHDAPEPIVIDAYGEGDIFEELYGVGA